MKSTDLRAKARAIFGNAIAEPMPKQPNGAAALQQRANARPIPTYKVGGVVKKADGGMMKPKLSAAERKMGDALMMTRKGKEVMAAQKQMEAAKEKAMAAKRAKADKLLGITAKKDGGKAGKYANGGIIDRVAQAISDIANQDKMKKYGIPKGERPSAPSGSGAQRSGSASGRGNNTPVTVTRREESVTVTPTAPKTQTVTPTALKTQRVKLNEKPKYVKLNPHKDGGKARKYAEGGDITAERVAARMAAGNYKKGGKVQTSADTAKKLATEMGGMKKGGAKKAKKDGLAVMIAIGKPVKKFMGGSMKARKMLDKLAPEARARMDASAGTVPAERPRGMIGKMMSNPKMAAAMEAARARMDASAGTVPAERPRGMIGKAMSNPKIAAAMEAARAKMGSPMDRMEAKMGSPVKKAVGGAGKTRKGQAPIKRAQGGAAKVRKGMMSPTGDIKQVVKPKKGLGGM